MQRGCPRRPRRARSQTKLIDVLSVREQRRPTTSLKFASGSADLVDPPGAVHLVVRSSSLLFAKMQGDPHGRPLARPSVASLTRSLSIVPLWARHLAARV